MFVVLSHGEVTLGRGMLEYNERFGFITAQIWRSNEIRNLTAAI